MSGIFLFRKRESMIVYYHDLLKTGY